MLRSHVLYSLILTVLLAAMPVGAQTFNECGVLTHGVEAGCIIFASDSHVEYLVIGDVSPFEVGDRVAIIGTVDPFIPTTCMQGLPLIIDTVFLCDDCCDGRVGDANGLGGDEPTIGDVAVMIHVRFICAGCLCEDLWPCVAEADVNQSGGCNLTCEDVTIGDVSILIDYLFISGLDPIGLPRCLDCP